MIVMPLVIVPGLILVSKGGVLTQMHKLLFRAICKLNTEIYKSVTNSEQKSKKALHDSFGSNVPQK